MCLLVIEVVLSRGIPMICYALKATSHCLPDARRKHLVLDFFLDRSREVYTLVSDLLCVRTCCLRDA